MAVASSTTGGGGGYQSVVVSCRVSSSRCDTDVRIRIEQQLFGILESEHAIHSSAAGAGE